MVEISFIIFLYSEGQTLSLKIFSVQINMSCTIGLSLKSTFFTSSNTKIEEVC